MSNFIPGNLKEGISVQVVSPGGPSAARGRHAHALASPPVVHVAVTGTVVVGLVQQATHAAHEFCVDELPGALPSEVRVVQGVVFVDFVQEFRQRSRTVEIVDVDVRVGRGDGSVVLWGSTHRHRQHIIPMIKKNHGSTTINTVII